mmetsp:Transcript_47685/g.102117  ORF Transcript_47685/g.102117 Transcript_47685/m.102117 type:complete len:235 (-) Transcript_47685:398-1102(-)
MPTAGGRGKRTAAATAAAGAAPCPRPRGVGCPFARHRALPCPPHLHPPPAREVALAGALLRRAPRALHSAQRPGEQCTQRGAELCTQRTSQPPLGTCLSRAATSAALELYCANGRAWVHHRHSHEQRRSDAPRWPGATAASGAAPLGCHLQGCLPATGGVLRRGYDGAERPARREARTPGQPRPSRWLLVGMLHRRGIGAHRFLHHCGLGRGATVGAFGRSWLGTAFVGWAGAA